MPLSLAILLPVLAAPPAVSLAGDYGEPKVIVSAPADPRFAHLSWPKVVRTPDGTLVVGYIAGRFHGTHGEGSPAVSVSTDGGKTFTPPKVLKEYAATDAYTSAGNLAMGLAADGAVVMLSMAFKADEANTIDGWRSADGGKSWKEADVSKLAGNRTGSVYGNVFPVPGKGLAVVGHYRKGSTTRDQGLWVSHSPDDGKTWGDPLTIAEPRLVEPAFVYAGGRYVGLVRGGRTPAYYVGVTSDDGAKWALDYKALVAEEPKGVGFPSPGLFVDPADPTRLLALVSQRFVEAAGNGLYGRIDLYAADAKELKWAKLGTVAKFPRALRERSDLTYAWMAPLGGRKWYAVFYCGQTKGPNDIYGLEFEVPAGK